MRLPVFSKQGVFVLKYRLPYFGVRRITFRPISKKARQLACFFGYNGSCLFKFIIRN